MTLFRGTNLASLGVDLLVRDGVIARIAPAGTLDVADTTVVEGGLVTPHLAEPHCHLDAALLGSRFPNRSGTLVEGIRNWAVARQALTHDDVRERALRTIAMYLEHGCTRIRTHVDTASRVAVEALLAVRDEVRADGVALEVVAFPQEGILRAPGRREAWEWAVAQGCDAVGAIPHFERTAEEGWATVRLAFDLAEKFGRKVDLHCDETDDPGSRNLEVVAAQSLDRGFRGRVVAGHCTALHSYPNPHAAKVVALVAEAGVQVVTNPLDNSVLQGRYDAGPVRRGHTRVKALWEAGVPVGVGHDSVQDPWYPLGRASLVDAAYVLVHFAHCSGQDEMERVFAALWSDNHLPFGEAPTIREGAAADLLWWPGPGAVDVLRERPRPRVFQRGVERFAR
jgi:cytosine deaminase